MLTMTSYGLCSNVVVKSVHTQWCKCSSTDDTVPWR